ncbi:MAG: DNA mismatch repair endonuclease MutL [Ndongobacter sp.]|nr:DNA mismatch repair endonuclease MutL [Ndongobacter sp.]
MIHLLNEDTIQKIAAGEVIERPVSVVKELVENAIDAGASEISVEIRNGGKELIRVTDNGTGIPPEEFELAFQRHATSKISSFDDLYRVCSLGFRGEALASIIAVSKVLARSKIEGAETGLELTFENSACRSRKPVAMQRGSEMTVRELFYNVPVRQKFMKSDSAEGNRISALLYSLAIGNPSISFRFIREDRRIFQTNRGHGARENLLLLFGRPYYEALIPVDERFENYRITGFIGNNTFYRGNRQMQFLYANGRYVEDETVRQVIEDAYRAIIPNGRFPAFQLFIQTDPTNIDINIHPNKQKIQFHRLEELLDGLRLLLKKALQQNRSIPGAVPEDEAKQPDDFSSENSYRRIIDAYRWSAPQTPPPTAPTAEDVQKKEAQDIQRMIEAQQMLSIEELSEEDGPLMHPDEAYEVHQHIEAYQPDAAEPDFVRTQEASRYPSASDTSKDAMQDNGFPENSSLRFLGVAFRTYLIFEQHATQTLYFVDQHAAHERINFERFLKQFQNGMVVSQQLLPPVSVPLTDWQTHRLQEREDVLRNIGYEFSSFGEHQVILRAVPTLFKAPEDSALFYDLLDLDIADCNDLDAIVDRLATKACKASVKQGDRLSEAEARQLIRNLGRCAYPFTCPHGRPTTIRRSRTDLEKLFLRIK